MLSNGAMFLQESIERFILSPGWGKVRRSRIGGGERSEPIRRMLFMLYDAESQSRNVLASPLGEEGHEVAKGCTRVRMIMTLDMDVTAERRHYKTHCPLKGKRLTTFCASLALLPNVFAVHRFDRGGRRLAVRTAIAHPIDALPRTPFPASRDFPSRGNERYEGKNSESYTSRTILVFSPFGGWRHHLSPAVRWGGKRKAP